MFTKTTMPEFKKFALLHFLVVLTPNSIILPLSLHYTTTSMITNPYSFVFLTLIIAPIPINSLRNIHPNPPCSPLNHKTLKPDQLTVVINGYSEHRIPLLHSIITTYATSPIVSTIILLWCNPTTPHQTLQNLSSTAATIIRAPSSSLNHRFYPYKAITTKYVLICDDDILPDPHSLSFAFKIHKSDPDRITGFFARSHAYDIESKTWIYTMERDKYSMILTKLMILDIKYMEMYTCWEKYKEAREIVERSNNCEDILMNFVVTSESGKGGVVVGVKNGVRDFGDLRNDGVLREIGLSSRKREHRKRRGDCLNEFHRVLGEMPLIYGYGKVVDGGGGEQGICEKNGRLVTCDDQGKEEEEEGSVKSVVLF